jgi:hypothetical protein
VRGDGPNSFVELVAVFRFEDIKDTAGLFLSRPRRRYDTSLEPPERAAGKSVAR